MKGSITGKWIGTALLTVFVYVGHLPHAEAQAFGQEPRIYDNPEVTAAPPEGYDVFVRQVAKAVRYPKEAKKAKKQGVVYIGFVINPDGNLSKAEVLSTFDKACGQAALAALKSVCAQTVWKPAMVKEQPVNQQFVLPIEFRL